ncbi:MAG: hypothetical protein GY810_32350 [Aureispira sp.]|nr:hypothetical protein [Aureispira sp.]
MDKISLVDKETGKMYTFTTSIADHTAIEGTKKIASTTLGMLLEHMPESESKPKRFDMVVCIKSGIDCEFSNAKGFPKNKTRIGKLQRVTLHDSGRYTYKPLHVFTEYLFCRPRIGHIHVHNEWMESPPVPEGCVVTVWDGDGYCYKNLEPKGVSWWDIHSFKVTGFLEEINNG